MSPMVNNISAVTYNDFLQRTMDTLIRIFFPSSEYTFILKLNYHGSYKEKITDLV